MGRLDLNVGLKAKSLKDLNGGRADETAKKKKTQTEVDIVEDYHTIYYINEDFRNEHGKGAIVWPALTGLADGDTRSFHIFRKSAASSHSRMFQLRTACIGQICWVSHGVIVQTS